MARIFGATYQPYTYEELAKPLREATVAHQKVEEDYNNNMLVVDSLRQRAANEPNAQWAKQITDYANNLEAYAEDLARNGLTRETQYNLLQAKRGYGTTVSPVLMAMLREKELQSVRDKAVGTNMVFGKMPSLDEIIANPNIGQVGYNGDDLYKKAHDLAASASERNIDIIKPRNLDAWKYEYGKKKGFTNDEISYMLSNEPAFAEMFGSIVNASGFNLDDGLDENQKNQLYNQIISGALTGFKYDEDWHYANRADNPTALLDYEIKDRQLHPERYPQYNQGDDIPEWDGVRTAYLPTYSSRQRDQRIKDVKLVLGDKSIVTNVTHTTNGNFYEISDKYVQDILDGLNRRHKVEKGAVYSAPYALGGMGTNLSASALTDQENQRWSEEGLRYGITKDDTVETAKRKINAWLDESQSYTNIADATQSVSMWIPVDTTKKPDMLHNYTNTKVKELDFDKDGRLVQTKNTVDLEKADIQGILQMSDGQVAVSVSVDGKAKLVPYPDRMASYARKGSGYFMEYSIGKQKQLNDNFNSDFASVKERANKGFPEFNNDVLALLEIDKSEMISMFNDSTVPMSWKENYLKSFYNAEMAYYSYMYSWYKQNAPQDTDALNSYKEKYRIAEKKIDKYNRANIEIEKSNKNTQNYLYNAATFSNTSKDQEIKP